MRRKLELAVVSLVAMASVIAVGCGSEETILPPGDTNIPVRNGTWFVSSTAAYTGSATCTARPDSSLDTTTVICDVEFIDASRQFLVLCDIEAVGGDSVIYDCTFTADLGLCFQVLEVFGSGTVNDTTFNLESTVVQRLKAGSLTLSECLTLYGNSIDPCTTLIASTGTWLSSDGDSLCPPDVGALSQGVPLEAFIGRAGTGLWDQQ